MKPSKFLAGLVRLCSSCRLYQEKTPFYASCTDSDSQVFTCCFSRHVCVRVDSHKEIPATCRLVVGFICYFSQCFHVQERQQLSTFNGVATWLTTKPYTYVVACWPAPYSCHACGRFSRGSTTPSSPVAWIPCPMPPNTLQQQGSY